MIGKTLAHYKITELIGKGGMGEVYRARDTKLDRDVALKILPADMTDHPDRLDRFQREAKAVAALSHPHIVHMYSVEEEAGVRFLTMELVEGQGLDMILSSEGLPLPKVFEIGIAVADALAAAHDNGVVHRDLKPANVMIGKDGRVKVLDFGLAKLAEDSAVSEETATDVAPITAEGTMLGTVPYMSPEQLRGQEVDHRSDIFSLGILLYELATGRRPFTGQTNSDVSSSILRDTPAPVTQLNPSLPHHLGRIVSHCLEKDPRDRYHSAIDIRNELRALRKEVESGVSEVSTVDSSVGKATAPVGRGKGLWMGLAAAAVVIVALVLMLGRGDRTSQPDANATQAPDSKSIAVMAFVNMSSDPEQEYFSDGIAEELLNLLAKIPELKVISRSSAFSYKGKDVPLTQVAEELGVAHILEGSVRKAGNQIRITAQLIEAKSDAHLWSQTYDREIKDIFAIQDEIAADVVEQLKVTLLGNVPRSKEVDPEAYALYLQARNFGRMGSVKSYERAIELYEQALAIDADYAAAWDGLANIYVNQSGNGLLPPAEGYELARESTKRALAIDPDYAKGHDRLGWIAMKYDGDLAAAARHYRRALELDPNDIAILNNSSSLLYQLGRLNETIAIREYFAERDPLNPNAFLGLGVYYGRARRWEESIAACREALRLSPDMIGPPIQINFCRLMMGDAESALEAYALVQDDYYRTVGLAMSFHALGRHEEFDEKLHEAIDRWGDEDPDVPAALYAWSGDVDKAFEWLDKWLKSDTATPFDPNEQVWDSLRDDPRWIELLEKIGRSPAQLDAIEFEVKVPRPGV